MRWIKQGLLYRPDGNPPWARRHAYPPTPHLLDAETLRIYLAFTDESNVGRAGYVDVSAQDPSRILGVSPEPVLDVGPHGAFDDNGVMPTSVVPVGDELYMYYTGFQLGQRLPYFQFEGLATSADGGESFARASRAPVLDRTDSESANRTSACVLLDEGVFRMWYSAGSEWTAAGGRQLPTYDIRYLESGDGRAWAGSGRVAIGFEDDEIALGRAWVFRHDGRYKMLFSRRTRAGAYGVGYAESSDGLEWSRDDKRAGLAASETGWDSAMAGYASVFSIGDTTYLFYNGNDGGPTGVGWATLEEW